MTWIDNLPQSLQWAKPYLFLARAGSASGWLLFFWPTAWAAALSAAAVKLPLEETLRRFAILTVWSLIMRSATCTINDIVDRDLDGKVERTKGRPLPAGKITVFRAMVWFILQVVAMQAVLVALDRTTQLIDIWCIFIASVYPFFKRFTYWSHFVCGLAVNPGVLVATSAFFHRIEWRIAGPLYAAGTLWSMGYESVYTHQDKHYDPIAGILSPALLYGDVWTKPIVAVFLSAVVALFAFEGMLQSLGPAYYVVGVIGGAIHLATNLLWVDLDDMKKCGRYFKANTRVGALLTAGIVADLVVRRSELGF